MLLGQELKFKNKLCNLKLGTFFSALPGLGASALSGRLFKIRIKIWYKKWCYIGVFKLLIFNTLIYKIVL